jgi:APA family basic amino acid/polyamine antiporter
MSESIAAPPGRSKEATTGFLRELGPLDSTMIVAGSMIGSGIFIVPAEIARQVGSSGWLLMVWVVTGLLTVAAALSYGELAAMMPKAGGQYVYLRESYSPLWGFLYGWTLFLVIQTGTIAAVAVGFARYLGVLVPSIGPEDWIVRPIDISSKYAISLSAQQLVGILMIVFLTWLNTRGIKLGKVIQNTFTSAKTLSLIALIVLGILVGRNAAAVSANFSDLWTPWRPRWAPSPCSSPSAWPRWARSSPRTPGTTSPSPPARSRTRSATSRSPWSPAPAW